MYQTTLQIKMLTIKSQNENADTKKIEALPAKCAALAAISSNNIRIHPFIAAKAQAPTTSCRNSSEVNVKQDKCTQTEAQTMTENPLDSELEAMKLDIEILQ